MILEDAISGTVELDFFVQRGASVMPTFDNVIGGGQNYYKKHLLV